MKRRARPVRSTAFRRPVYRRYDQSVTIPFRTGVPRKRALRQAQTRARIRAISLPRLLSGSTVLAVALISVWIGFSDTFYVRRPVVTGNLRVPAQSIVAGSRIAGMHVLWLNTKETEVTLLREVPQLESAHMSCRLPADCSIAVSEREPLLAWRWGQAVVWIDRAGVAFPAQGDAPDLLTVESIDAPAPVPGQKIDQKLMSAIVSASVELPDVGRYRYTLARGLEFDDPKGYPVYLGAGANMQDRATVWRALRDDLSRREIVPAYIDVRFPLAPYYGR